MLEHPFALDLRHREWLRHVLMSGKFSRVLEIGSWQGFSTEAFLDALQAGKVQEVVLCEPSPQPALMKRIEKVTAPGLKLYMANSLDLLDKDTAFDLVFVDGLHIKSHVLKELERLLPSNIPVIFAHDVGSDGRHQFCDGPQWLQRAYQQAGYYCLTDSVLREGEQTERGMFGAARALDLYVTLLEGYRAHC